MLNPYRILSNLKRVRQDYLLMYYIKNKAECISLILKYTYVCLYSSISTYLHIKMYTYTFVYTQTLFLNRFITTYSLLKELQ